MGRKVYILAECQSDFARNWKKENKPMVDGFKEVMRDRLSLSFFPHSSMGAFEGGEVSINQFFASFYLTGNAERDIF